MGENSSKLLVAVAALVIGTFATLGDSPAHAESACDVVSVAGEYGFEIDGFANKQARNDKSQIFVQKPLRGIGVLALNTDATADVLIKGFIADTPQFDQDDPEVIEFTGTWSVNDDCTGQIDLDEFDSVVDWLFVSVSGGTELFLLSNASLSQLQAKRL
jgi:hypothetical protein